MIRIIIDRFCSKLKFKGHSYLTLFKITSRLPLLLSCNQNIQGVHFRLALQKLYSVLNSLAAQCIINRGGGLFTVNLLQVCEFDKREFLRGGVR